MYEVVELGKLSLFCKWKFKNDRSAAFLETKTKFFANFVLGQLLPLKYLLKRTKLNWLTLPQSLLFLQEVSK